jgi:hypothetical protein
MFGPSVRLAALLALVGLTAGCGPSPVRGVKVRGQVVSEGKPLKPLPGERSG